MRDDLATGRPLRLELGSGGAARDGFYGLDLRALPGIAIEADLDEPLDALPNDSVEHVRSEHCLEHVTNLLQLVRELHRVVRPGGTIEILVPHFSNPHYYSDPTHVRPFGLYTFYYFASTDRQPSRKVPCFYSDVRFDIQRIQINLQPRSLLKRLRYPKLGTLINRSFAWQDWWERHLCWTAPAETICYWLTPIKAECSSRASFA